MKYIISKTELLSRLGVKKKEYRVFAMRMKVLFKIIYSSGVIIGPPKITSSHISGIINK